jgi:hypothetical protein
MSTTNPGGDAPRPVEGPRPGAGPEWPHDATRLDAPDDSAGGGGVNAAAIRAGHEPDAFYVKPILSIPLAVVVTFVIAFGVVTVIFAFVMVSRADPTAHPAIVKENEKPINDQLAGIDRKGANGNPNVKSDNSRNEANQLLEESGQTITRFPLKNGYNSPVLHAEDVNPALRPDKVPGLTTAAPGTGTVTIDKAMADAGGDQKTSLVPVRKDPVKLAGSDPRPTGANAGRGVSPKPPKFPEAKTEAKGETPKADPKTPTPDPKTPTPDPKAPMPPKK